MSFSAKAFAREQFGISTPSIETTLNPAKQDLGMFLDELNALISSGEVAFSSFQVNAVLHSSTIVRVVAQALAHENPSQSLSKYQYRSDLQKLILKLTAQSPYEFFAEKNSELLYLLHPSQLVPFINLLAEPQLHVSLADNLIPQTYEVLRMLGQLTSRQT